MTRTLLVAILFVVAACSTDTPSVGTVAGDGPVLPDTQSVDGVLVMRHSADAFARAPQWRVADSAAAVFDGGDDANLDLTNVYRPALLSDGSLVAVRRRREGRVMLFPADGSAGRVIASPGKGPGDVRRPSDPLVFGDSIAVLDDGTGRVNWFSTEGALLGHETLWPGTRVSCLEAAGVLPSRRLLAVNRCIGRQEEIPKEGGRWLAEVITAKLDFTEIDTIVTLPDPEMVWFERRYPGERRDHPMMLRLTRTAHAAVWGSSVAVSTDGHGYVIERRAPDGTVNGRLEVVGPRQPVTDVMREFVIAQELERIDQRGGERNMMDVEESRRLAREVPFADSLPAFSTMFSGANGVLWVMDGRAPTDTTWAATAFREDGEIFARLTGTGQSWQSWPMLILDDRVLLRTTDDDGVVRFEVRRIVKP